MKIRWKLLSVMLSISLVPIMLVLWYGRQVMQDLGDEIATNTRKVLVQKANLELSIIVEEHARILQRERDLIEMALKLQASEVQQRLSRLQAQNLQNNRQRFQKEAPASTNFRQSDRHFRRMGMMGITPLFISYEHQTVLSPETDHTYVSSLSSMVPVYHALASKHPQLILWQVTALENGFQTIYPAIRHYPRWYNTLATEWYRKARNKKDIFWSLPAIDPFTGGFVLIASAPLFKDKGIFMGVTSIMVPLSVVLQEDRHIRNISEGFTSLLIRAEYIPARGSKGIRIIAREQRMEQMHPVWQTTQVDEWLNMEEKSLAALIDDLEKREDGVIEFPYDGAESIAAFGSIDEFGTALMLIIAKTEIIAEAVRMQRYVLDRINHQIRITGIILLGVFITVILLALVLSRTVTGNIQKLVEASRRIASGDFETRVRIRSNDEMGELGRSFDRMVPELEERIQMKQALDMAMQVQQNLLPQKMPRFEALDIAARSIYCDETGGDFYDFMDFCCRDPGVVGVVVGDVSGHGIPAALLMASTRAFLRCRVTQPGDIVEIISDVNRLVANDVGETGRFLTLFYMELNTREKRLEWIRAGHDPAFVYHPDSDSFEDLYGQGLVLGVESDMVYRRNMMSGLNSGQIITLGTDGLWETQNSSGERFGKDRLKSIVRQGAKMSAEDILTSILQELEAFRGTAKQEDDVTLVIMKIM